MVEDGAKIYAPAHISDGSHICRGATLMPGCVVKNSYVGAETVVFSSTLCSAHISARCTVGPYAYLRPNAYLCENCRVGSFVEIKNSVLSEGVKVAHLTYVGDADVGAGTNVGCGVVFANYDGKSKFRSKIGEKCFIGCNCNIVAPVNVSAGCYIAAGTTLTKNLNENDFCIGRSREKIKENGAAERYGG